MNSRSMWRCASKGLTRREDTLVSLLIVVLAGAAVPLFSTGCRRHPPQTIMKTKLDIATLTMALNYYQKELSAYPPDGIAAAGGSGEHGANEALVFYLGRKHKVGANYYGPYMEFKKERLTDEDADGFREFRDPWGGLYLYAENASHATPTGMNAESFDIVSAGRDGELGGTISPATGYVPATTREGRAREKDNVTNWRDAAAVESGAR